MTGDPRIDGYDWAGGREAMLRFGQDTGPVVIVALPLFEEANRTRAFVVAILRALAARGIGSVLPDLPGQGESLALLETVSLADMQAAFAAVVAEVGRDGGPSYTIAVRSGALVTDVLPRRREPSLGPRLRGDTGSDEAAGANAATRNRRWLLSPQDGPSLLRELSRIRKADGNSGDLDTKTALVAGNLLSPALLGELATRTIGQADRTVRLTTDPVPADRHVDGPPLWRRSEPGADDALSQILALDIADWIVACEG